MKVVLFCGGFGMRMRGNEHDVPKPLQMVGDRPLLWHLMRYYAHYGHTDFVLCLGFGGEHIKRFFLDYRTVSSDFRLTNVGVELLSTEMPDWTITFVDTGLDASIGQRLWRVREHLTGESVFLANYADVLTDADLDAEVGDFEAQPDKVACLMAVPPQSSFHVVDMDHDHRVTAIEPVSSRAMRENGGYLVLRHEIFDFLESGGDLVGDAFPTLAAQGRLMAWPHDGFWKPADTFKERAALDELWKSGEHPWAVWER